ncbi:MAG: hypothetical protein M5U15_15140 [Kiritimatiellae bacterium]|nr:hypothetical protein [Kiritimatiellia bacterium]
MLSQHIGMPRGTAAAKKMVEEILNLGFHRLELGYDLRLELVAGRSVNGAQWSCPGG